MTFGHSQLLFGLILLPMAILFMVWANRRRQVAIARLGHPALIARLSESINWRGRWWRKRLWLLTLALLLVAMARPQWGNEVQVVEQKGVEIMAVLDISESMMVSDLKPNRLSRAKLEIADLLTRLKGDEIGLVLFSGASFVQFPLTSDYTTALSFLDNAQPGLISKPGTAIGEAINTAVAGFDAHRATQKVIVIFTDGENLETDPLDAANKAAEQNILIYTIGFGSPEGEPIPEYNQQKEVIGYKKNQQGETVVSKLDEITLQKIALAGHGRYFRATADGRELVSLIDELDKLQRQTLESQFEVRRVERFQIFLLLALVMMVIGESLTDRRGIN